MNKPLFLAVAVLGLAACDPSTLTFNSVGDACEIAQTALDTAQEAVVAYQAADTGKPVPKVLTDNLAAATRLVSACPAVAAVVDNAVAEAN